jgi:predicted RNA binding protein YcfA (HicA-like mRNA interferase family)
MKLPRDLSGRVLIRHLCRHWSYRVIGQAGSHVTLETDEPVRQRIVVPDHAALRIGTLNEILRAVADHKGSTKVELLKGL